MDARDGQALDVLPLGSVLACTHESGLLGSVKPYVSQRAVLPLGPYEMKTSSPSAMSLLAVKMNAPSSSLPGRGCEHRSQHSAHGFVAKRAEACRDTYAFGVVVEHIGERHLQASPRARAHGIPRPLKILERERVRRKRLRVLRQELVVEERLHGLDVLVRVANVIYAQRERESQSGVACQRWSLQWRHLLRTVAPSP